jgi:type II secretory pathway component PulC
LINNKNMANKHSKSALKKTIKICLILAVIILLILFIWRILEKKNTIVGTANNSKSTSNTSKKITALSNSQVTTTDKGVAAQNTQELPSTNGSNNVTPIITSSTKTASTVGVFAFVSGIVENNGICKLTLANGSKSYSETITASAQGTTTNCGNITIDKSLLTVGDTYTATVTYSSPTSYGVSTQSWTISVIQ